MAKATYVQRGETLDYKNGTNKKIEAGAVVALASRVGVAGCDIAPGETGTIHMAGVFRMPKSKDAEIAMGTAVYFDGAGITSDADDGAEGNAAAYVPAGYAAAAAGAGDTDIAVKLPG